MIVAVCGPPGVGKTTVATRLQRRLAERGRTFDVLHSDDFRRRTYERMAARVADGGDWIVDGTFYRREHQARFRTLGAAFARLTASLETCLRRNRERATPVDEQGVHVVYREFHEFDADVTVDTDDCSPDETVDRIVAALDLLA